MREIRVLAAARAEAERATVARERTTWLGEEFEAAVDAALDLLMLDPIPSLPVRGRVATRGVWRLILKRFPFDAIFVENSGFIFVIAFANHARRPGFWLRRLRT